MSAILSINEVNLSKKMVSGLQPKEKIGDLTRERVCITPAPDAQTER